MERLLFHSNPRTRQDSENRQTEFGGWKSYQPRLYYEYTLETVIAKANNIDSKGVQNPGTCSTLDNNMKIFSREYLLTCIYQMFCSSSVRNSDDNSPAIICYSTKSSKTQHFLQFVELSISSIPTDIDNKSDHGLYEKNSLEYGIINSMNLPVKSSKSIKSRKKSQSNNLKGPNSSHHILATNVNSITKQKNSSHVSSKLSSQKWKKNVTKNKLSQVTYSPVFKLKETWRIKNVFFKSYFSNVEGYGNLFGKFDLIDAILSYSIIKYQEYLSTINQTYVRNHFIVYWLSESIGKCKFEFPMFFKDGDKMIDVLGNRLKPLEDDESYMPYKHWSIDPKEKNVAKCEKSARSDPWLRFLHRLKCGITKSAYQRLLDAFDYYIRIRFSLYDNIPYLNGRSSEVKGNINFDDLDDYQERYDILHHKDGADKTTHVPISN